MRNAPYGQKASFSELVCQILHTSPEMSVSMSTMGTGAGRGRRGKRNESGSSAVEFALVSGVLFLVVFGIIQYGLYFNDALSVRQAVREAARHGVVKDFPSCGGKTEELDKLACYTEQQVGALTGPTYVKIVQPAEWKKGKPLTVCAMVKSDGGIGLLPMPADGWITSKTQMSIEQDTHPLPTGAAAPADPPGADWNWCA